MKPLFTKSSSKIKMADSIWRMKKAVYVWIHSKLENWLFSKLLITKYSSNWKIQSSRSKMAEIMIFIKRFNKKSRNGYFRGRLRRNLKIAIDHAINFKIKSSVFRRCLLDIRANVYCCLRKDLINLVKWKLVIIFKIKIMY